jgi:hypothetical protein
MRKLGYDVGMMKRWFDCENKKNSGEGSSSNAKI